MVQHIYKPIMVLLLLITVYPAAGSISSGFGGSQYENTLSSSSVYELKLDDNVNEQSTITLGKDILLDEASEGVGGMDKKYVQGSASGPYAATYAHLDDSTSWKWDFGTSTCSCYVGVSEKVTVVDGTGLFFGGFAYNQAGDYAAAQVIGGSDTASMTYSNYMKTNRRGALAGQSAKDATGNLEFVNWGENGNADEEVKTVEEALNGGDPIFGPQGDEADYTRLAKLEATISTEDPIKSYTSVAESAQGTAKGSHSMDISSADNVEVTETALNPDNKAISSGTIESGTKIKISGSASGSSKVAKTSQKLKSTSFQNANIANEAHYNDDGEITTTLQINNDAGITGSIDSKYVTSASGSSLSLSEKLTCTGSIIQREVNSKYDSSWLASSAVYLGSDSATTLSSLKGTSKTISSSKGAKITGSWTTFQDRSEPATRTSSADNGVDMISSSTSWTGSYKFKEKVTANSKGVELT